MTDQMLLKLDTARWIFDGRFYHHVSKKKNRRVSREAEQEYTSLYIFLNMQALTLYHGMSWESMMHDFHSQRKFSGRLSFETLERTYTFTLNESRFRRRAFNNMVWLHRLPPPLSHPPSPHVLLRNRQETNSFWILYIQLWMVTDFSKHVLANRSNGSKWKLEIKNVLKCPVIFYRIQKLSFPTDNKRNRMHETLSGIMTRLCVLHTAITLVFCHRRCEHKSGRNKNKTF